MNFLISNFNTIFIMIWSIFIAIVAVRYFLPHLVKNISYWWLIAVAVFIHLLYGALVTLFQYSVWAGTEFTKVFLVVPVAKEVPFPTLLEWTRPLFSGAHGYFALYSIQHFFLSSLVLFFIVGLFAIFFKVYAFYRQDTFMKGDIAIIALSFLIAGYYGAIVLVPLAFTLAVLISLLNLISSKVSQISLPASFLIISPFALIFAVPILKYLNLYSTFKL